LTLLVLYASIALATGLLAIGYARSDWSYLLPWILFFGVAWIVAQRRGWQWFPAIGLALTAVGAAFGLMLEINSTWMVAGVLFSLIAWDLSAFRERTQFAAAEDVPGMEKRHLARLGVLAAVGTVLASLPMLFHLKFGFGWLVFFVFAAALAFAQLVSWIHQK
jgi:hypothetical protein